ncbi:MAG: hypothetical protein E7254_06655 [Lachnospiraceae bacterium]|nr:hypothetical protein [Lachnospiraceae bacterium]
MANSRLRALSGIDNAGEKKTESRFSQLQKDNSNAVDEKDVNPIMVKKQEIERIVAECKESNPEKRGALEAVEADILKSRQKVEAINKNISIAGVLSSKVQKITKTYEDVIRASASKSTLSSKTPLGGMINKKVLGAMGKDVTEKDLVEMKDDILDFIDQLEDGNPIKRITEEEEFERLKTVDKNSDGIPWSQAMGLFSIGSPKETTDLIAQLNRLDQKCRDIKTDIYLSINEELKNENDLYDKLDEIVKM